MPFRSSRIKLAWLVVFLVLVVWGPFCVYDKSPMQILDAETPSAATSTPSHPVSLAESVASYGTPDVAKFPAPSIPEFEGEGANFTATQYIERMDSAYVTTGVWGDDPYERVDTHNKTITCNQPAEGSISHMACAIDNVYGYDERIGLVPNGDFEDWPFRDIYPYGGYWDTATGGTGNEFCTFGWITPVPLLGIPGMLTMTVASNIVDLPHSSRGEVSSKVDTSPLPAGEYLRAFLHFDLRVAERAVPFTYIEDTTIRVRFDGSTIWHRDYGRIDGEDRDHEYLNVYVDVTDRIGTGGSFEIELYCISTTSCVSPATSSVTTSWSDIKLFVTEKIPILPTGMYIKDLESNQKYYFNSQGFTEFFTAATSWEFGPDPHHYCDANWTVIATVAETKNMTSTFSAILDAPSVLWNVISPSPSVPVTPGWIHSRYESVFPITWTYNQSEAGIGSHWEGSLHMLSCFTSGWHQFLSPNDAVVDIIIAMQNHTQIIRSQCYHFMRGEQYAVTVSGIPGSYYLDVYNPLTYHESGDGWIQNNEMWKHNNTGQILCLPLDAPLGSYTTAISCLGTDPLIQVGYSSVQFEVNEYPITTMESEKNPDGTVTVSGQLGFEAGGDFKVYIARVVFQTPAINRRYNRVFGDMELYDWYQTDCLISATGESIDIRFTVNNTGVVKENVTVTVRFLSLAGRSYVLFEKSSLVTTWDNNQIQEFDWPNIWIGPVGNNTMLRRGFYSMELEINGQRIGLHGGEYGSLLAVTDNPSLQGRVPAIHTGSVAHPTFSKTFSRHFSSEMNLPGTNYFLATVMDSHHITATSVPVCFESLKLNTWLERPTFNNRSYHGCTVVHRNGSITAIAILQGEIPCLTEYRYMEREFVLDFYVNWTTEFEYWRSASILCNDSSPNLYEYLFLTTSNPEGYPSGSYPLLIRYQGDDCTHPCEMYNTLEFARSTITTPVPGPGTSAGFGQRGSLMAQLQAWTYESHYGWINPGYGPIAGQELTFTIHNGITWQIIGVGITGSDGWAQIFYMAYLVPGTYRVRVIFEGSGFLAESMAEYNISIGMSVLFIGIISPIIVIPLVISALVIRKIRKRPTEGGE